jgi:hypothetical protein
MRKINHFPLFLLIAFLLVVLVNCTKTTKTVLNVQDEFFNVANIPVLNFEPDLTATKRAVSPERILQNGNLRTVFTSSNSASLRSAGCGGSFSGSWANNGYHQYATDTIRLDSVAQGKTIKVYVSSYEVPNRFAVYDASTGGIVASSSWMGYANYPGPWGMSLNTAQSGTLTFTRGAAALYYFVVETSVNGTSDSYYATVSCL